MKILRDYLSLLETDLLKEDIIAKFDKFSALIIEWNAKFNLTAIIEPEEIEVKHFIDSLLALKYISGSVIDIGAGAGLPGIPLKIMSDASFTLVDCVNKKVKFMETAIRELGLANITAIHSRAEDLPKSTLYDTGIARAVAQLNVLCELTLPFIKVGGLMIAYKSANAEEEINAAKSAIKILGGKIEKVEDVPLFGSDIIRKLVLIRKIAPTPIIYPRKNNKPKTSPLSMKGTIV